MKKGFTLIELLAVIVILAIIALIATPIILGIIEDARKGSIEASANGYIDAVEYNSARSELKGNEISDGIYNINDLDIDVDGEKPAYGEVTIEKGKVENATFVINGYTVNYDGTKARVEGNAPTYKVYENGTAVYYDPVLGEECKEADAISTTGTKTGCMKFYTFNDEGKYSDKVNMILDHNTTPLVAWNSLGTNTEMKEVKEALENDTSNWKDKKTVRLITADEVAKITGNATFNSKISTTSEYFYFETNTSTIPNSYSNIYSWLYEYTHSCASYGCNIADENKYEYSTEGLINYIYGSWTSTPVAGSTYYTWIVDRCGRLDDHNVGDWQYYGVRPVITISKSLIS